MDSCARRERASLADLLAEVGPDAPTLCEGWHARQLAAHLIIREHRLDAVPGILFRPFAGHTGRVLARYADRPFTELVVTVRSGPPAWSPTRIPAVDAAANTVEFFVHHEDVRRARPDWSPRSDDLALEQALAARLRQMAKLSFRRSPVGVRLEPAGHSPIEAKSGEDMVAIVGPPGEIVMFMNGRRRHARVELQGTADALRRLEQVSLGV
jgi:uncharacterized protein (TIGR03085 family)